MKSRFLGASCVAALLAAWGSAAVAAEVAAQADDGSEEVVVTAQKRSERVHNARLAGVVWPDEDVQSFLELKGDVLELAEIHDPQLG